MSQSGHARCLTSQTKRTALPCGASCESGELAGSNMPSLRQTNSVSSAAFILAVGVFTALFSNVAFFKDAVSI